MDELVTRDDGTIIADVGRITRLVVPAGGPTGPLEDPNDPGYPDVIVDQRTGYHGLETTSVEEVIVTWDGFLGNQRPPVARTVTTDEVVPYINQSRWVADCSCGGGMLCWDRNGQTCCLGCGTTWSVAWQDPALRAQVIRLLAIREPQHRNWDPRRVDDQGQMIETPDYLERENLLMLGTPGGL